MTWFRDLTGLDRDDPDTVRAALQVRADGTLMARATGRILRPGVLELPALADLRQQTRTLRRGRTWFSEVIGDAIALHADPANAGAVFQVASQTNLLEMTGPDVDPEMGIARYAHDHTQGPACAMACGAGTLWRNYFVPLRGQTGQSADRQINALADLAQALGSPFEFRNGYALPRPGGLAAVARRLWAMPPAERLDLIGTLRVGVQAGTEVTLPGAGHCVQQVYCSALPVAYADAAAAEWTPLAPLVLKASYEATLRWAAAQAAAGGDSRVFLTRLGGGAFGNPGEWIDDAVAYALAQVAAMGLEVVLVSHAGLTGAANAMATRLPRGLIDIA